MQLQRVLEKRLEGCKFNEQDLIIVGELLNGLATLLRRVEDLVSHNR